MADESLAWMTAKTTRLATRLAAMESREEESNVMRALDGRVFAELGRG